MDLLAAQLEERHRLREAMRGVRRHHRRMVFRCLRLETQLRQTGRDYPQADKHKGP